MMRIDYPNSGQVAQLRQLWSEAFGDEEEFLDAFFIRVFSSDRCRCVTEGDKVTAALYWLDCRCDGRPMAYLYAIATARAHRKKGLCRAMMEDTHRLLKDLGYAGCLLVPGSRGLFDMYETMGYRVCSQIREWSCCAGEQGIGLRRVSAQEYADLRRQYLPAGTVVQEGENLVLLEAMTRLYAGEDFLLCASEKDGHLNCPEFLGNAAAAPAVLASLKIPEGTFRGPGEGRDFAMYYPLSDGSAPDYFGLAFD